MINNNNKPEDNILSFEQEKKKQEEKKGMLDAYHTKIENECYDLFQWYQTEDGGKLSLEEAYLKAAKAMEEADECIKVNEGVDGRDMQVRKWVALSFLEQHANWKYLDKEGKSKVLWKLGFNTRNFAYKQTTRRVYNNTKMKEEAIIEGFERMDKGWLNMRREDYSHYASDEVRMVSDNKRYGGISIRSITEPKGGLTRDDINSKFQIV